ncbi:calcyclin-binding protein-like [Scaptodrosophila lebanonensis]|uniref:Calcyclin-binding protein-like n=1 Tax=Drosophila lebanonensis TaxID=7225 RepID=A0A6J2U471_DROLE|nr:calcyclin-binding protein-like [Scaptodrosophila lebanonensis]
MSLEELKAELAEFDKFLKLARCAGVKNILGQAKMETERKIVDLEIEESNAAAAADSNSKRYLHELTDYGWDQSDKFIKMFITLNGVQRCPENAVTLHYSGSSLQLLVRNLKGKDYSLTVNNLLHSIDIEKSYRKLKTDLVAIYLKKVEEGVHWDVLTVMQKRTNKMKDIKIDEKQMSPEYALAKIMKKLYTDGDQRTKQMVEKAWTDSQKARLQNVLM